MSKPNIKNNEKKEKLITSLLDQMTLEEKVGQLYQTAIMGEFDYGPAFEKNNVSVLIKEGKLGSMIGPYDNQVSMKLQKIAVEHSRLGIPLMFCNDIIHGCRTGFPVNIAMSGSFNPELVKKSAEVIAFETSHSGTHVTFAPMLDIVRDPRWGRVVESPGEDPHLGSVMADAWVSGFQGEDPSDGNHIASCAKHFVAYGAAEAGREYNTVDISERMLRNIYLKPFKQAVDSGVKMVMSAFNVYDGVPMTANKFLLDDVLRKEMGFDSVIVSDYTSTEEIMNHKIAKNKEEVAEKCLNATLDIEMISTSFLKHLPELAQHSPKILDQINASCKRVLGLKYDLGLFDKPYKNMYPKFEDYFLLPESRHMSLQMALESAVLLENKTHILPLDKTQKIALIGPFSTTNRLVGPWGGKARNEDCVTFYEGLSKVFDHVMVSEGSKLKEMTEDMISDAVKIAREADVVILALGEDQYESGEANSKTNISLSDAQYELVKAVNEVNKRIVAVIFSGRPLILTPLIPYVDGLLYAWFLGTETGHALADLLSGSKNPSGRLAMTFPRHQGQIPLYYNHMKTGRPLDPINHPHNHYTSRYLDSVNTPLYPFGYGLSYSTFEHTDIKVSRDVFENGTLEVILDVKNTSDHAGYDVIQLYIEALHFSVTRPVNELKAFNKVYLKPHETKQLTFELTMDDFKAYGYPMHYSTESASYLIKLGNNSNDIFYTHQIQLKEGI
ncbi:MAG: hypothetical protein A2Y45_07775 [Tenericutes bacterium GWC2_34_14]|nr:MAG: hypothetical protein A2Z84_02365 [Tenericutes bacterium GWA2_35_7]OHE29798.1 MAG: hypothetical protein A2Y45_07775 [Tenericutes bacterium GWC2_34_14]OHE34777.1 MAG: hypothetical protein A2012_01385 [Tenericutes bacterium GWE2_34_108]OHE37362.1 MAG: hypothetical protein A2Y46_01625 [Tenericutes bacterium GWF1_35_14]OHE39505.1 MAG: hypothetical protein A2Y44_01235 [Tenericutes bacterium GWF2_35_184]OHE44306.1 MAG: hypothetical protein A2221_04275 [Tenericutes bacterium RIFOXYA2_FULL_36_3